MIRILYVLRHAQSVGKQSGQADYDRELSPAGIEESKHLGEKLRQRKLAIDLVLSSTAVRARQTFSHVNESLGISDQNVEFHDTLYEAHLTQFLDLLKQTSEQIRSVMLVGHNPFLSAFASDLCRKPVDMVPCEFLGIQLGGESWQVVSHGVEILDIKPE